MRNFYNGSKRLCYTVRKRFEGLHFEIKVPWSFNVASESFWRNEKYSKRDKKSSKEKQKERMSPV
jgi:hypothetical protein